MADKQQHAELEDRRLIRRVVCFSCLLLVLLSAGSWLAVDKVFAISVLIGGILANSSFLLLKNDTEQILGKVAVAGGRSGTVSRVETVRFFIKFYARLIILGLLLLVLIARVEMDMIGLSLGLATIMISVIAMMLSRVKKTGR
ncbi:MAG: hypothetical protein CSA32_02360 [Desulfobulbus propionicus]|nr:MAG: hypothetical protein CSA32_02360 [Desulfobulbus propionicus]